VIDVTISSGRRVSMGTMPRLTHSIAGLAATAVVATGPGLAEAAASPPRQIVYGCQVSMLWRVPGHHPIGFLVPGARFEVKGYSPSRRWAEGMTGSPGARHRQEGWVRISGLCRHRPR
jgi:hypothetical protein